MRAFAIESRMKNRRSSLTDAWRRARRPLLVFFLLLQCLLLVTGALRADDLSELPVAWQSRLLPVVEGDISGAEPLMREALTQARRSVAERLAQGSEAADPKALADAYGRLGVLLLLLEVENPADAALRNAARLQPLEFRWPYYSGYMAMLAGNTDRALADLRRAQEIDPAYRPLEVHLGRVLLERSTLADARAVLEPVASVAGLSASADYYLGQIALLERRYPDAVDLLTRSLEADPKALGTHYPLAQAYRALGQDALARTHLEQFEMIVPFPADPRIVEMKGAVQRSIPAFERGLEAVRKGDYRDAERLFGEGLEVVPDNAAARISLARTLYLTQQPEAAERELQRAVATDPSQALGHLLLGVLALNRGDQDAASVPFTRATEADPRQAGALFYLAGLDFAAARWAKAAEGYRQAVAIEPALGPAKLLGVVAAFRAAQSSEDPTRQALAALTELRESVPQDPQIGYALVCLLCAAPDQRLRNPEEALSIVDELLQTIPAPPLQRARAMALAAGGRFEDARALMRETLSAALWGASNAVVDLIKEDLAAFERNALPEPWPVGDPMLSPPPLDATAVFRDYPAVDPY